MSGCAFCAMFRCTVQFTVQCTVPPPPPRCVAGSARGGCAGCGEFCCSLRHCRKCTSFGQKARHFPRRRARGQTPPTALSKKHLPANYTCLHLISGSLLLMACDRDRLLLKSAFFLSWLFPYSDED